MDSKGQATVEFALAALLLIALVFAIMDLAVMFFVNLTMQHAVREGIRSVVIGQPSLGSVIDLRAALNKKIQDSSFGFYEKNALPDHDPTVSVLAPTDVKFLQYTTHPVKDTGQPSQTIIVSLNYAWPLITPTLTPFFTNGQYTFTARATMTNEHWGK